MNKQEIGKWGENQAKNYLLKQNYKILEQNYHTKLGEIDLIAYDIKEKEIIFAEVKTRTSLTYGRPIEAITNLKKQHICKSSQYYLYQRQIKKCNFRFDGIEVYASILKRGELKVLRIQQIKNIF